MSEAESRYSTCIHEAGHAVAAHFRRLGGLTDVVVVDQTAEERRSDPLRRGFHSRRTSLPLVVGRQIDEDALRDRILITLAGPEAQRRHAGDGNVGDDGDRSTAEALLMTAFSDEFDALLDEEHELFKKRFRARVDALVAEPMNAARRDAKALMTEHWHLVEAVAAALEKRGRLTGDEVSGIIEALEDGATVSATTVAS